MPKLRRNRFGEMMSWLDSPKGWQWVVGPALVLIMLTLLMLLGACAWVYAT